jgi:hypothetical protein
MLQLKSEDSGIFNRKIKIQDSVWRGVSSRRGGGANDGAFFGFGSSISILRPLTNDWLKYVSWRGSIVVHG